jgi:hypothetical protein
VPWPNSTGFIVAIAKLVGGLADGHGAILQAFEEGALRLERDAVDLVEQDDFRLGQRADLGGQLAGRRVDHLEADHLGRLQVGASLDARELGVADGRQDHAEERLAHARHAAQQQVAGVDLPLFFLVVGRRDLRQQHEIGQDFGLGVTDEGLAAFRENGFVEGDRFLEVRMHGSAYELCLAARRAAEAVIVSRLAWNPPKIPSGGVGGKAEPFARLAAVGVK